ncbi:MAG: hypothetical protein HDT13_11330 [Butyrivibrio sp.]|nr:hypothetical protein [Butyrivibrio sp.]
MGKGLPGQFPYLVQTILQSLNICRIDTAGFVDPFESLREHHIHRQGHFSKDIDKTFMDRVFFLDTIDSVQDEIKDFPDTGLYRVNMLKYNVSPDMGGVTYDGVCKWKAFLSVDLDRDGIKEVIVQRDSGSMMSLHYAGGEVYMTKVPNSLGYEIYENGVWTATNGAFGICYWRIYPAKGAMYIQKLAEENRRGYGSPLETYMIMDKSVTMEEHDAYVERLVGGLTPLEWYDFTEENIDRYVID